MYYKILFFIFVSLLLINSITIFYSPTKECLNDKSQCKSVLKILGDSVFSLDKHIKDNMEKALSDDKQYRSWYLTLSFFYFFEFITIIYILKKLFVRKNDLDNTSMTFKYVIFASLLFTYLFLSMLYNYLINKVLIVPGSGFYYLFKGIINIFMGVQI